MKSLARVKQVKKALLPFSFFLSPVISHRPSVFVFEFVYLSAPNLFRYAHKKAWHFFAFISRSEAFDNLILPNYNVKAHAKWRERRCFTLGSII
jgi:hypothetical protein